MQSFSPLSQFYLQTSSVLLESQTYSAGFFYVLFIPKKYNYNVKKKFIKITIAIILLLVITIQTYNAFSKYETDSKENDNDIQDVIVNSDVSFKNGKQKYVIKDLKTNKQYQVESYETDYIKPYQCYTLKSYKLQSLDKQNYSSNDDDVYKLISIPTKYYYAKDGITKKIIIKEKVILDCKKDLITTIKSYALSIRKYLIEKFLNIYDQPYAGFVAGILVAGKGLMSDETLSMFKKINLSHVVVLSGSNVAIIVSAMVMIASMFGSGVLYKIILITSVIIFSSITGFDPPILRATLSAVFVILFKEKIHDSVLVLFIVAFFMYVIIMIVRELFYNLYHCG